MGAAPTARAEGLRWGYGHTVLACCGLVFATYHAGRQIVYPALPLIREEYHLTYMQTGFISSSYEIGYGLALFLGGYLASRFRLKALIAGGLLWFATMLSLTALSSNFIELAAARIATAIAMGLYFAAGISLISHYFGERKRGMALAIHWGVGGGAGQFFTPMLVGLGLVVLGWRTIFLFLAVIAAIVALVFWKTINRPVDGARVEPVAFGDLWRKGIANPTFTVLGLVNASLTTGMVIVFSFFPSYAVENLALSTMSASLLLAVFNGVGIPSALLFGLLSDKWGRRPVILFLAVSSCAVFVLFYAFPSTEAALPLMAVAGLIVGTGFPITLSYVVDLTPAEFRSLGVGYANMVTVLTTSLLLLLAGYLSDAFGMSSAFVFGAAISLAGSIGMVRRMGPAPALNAR